MNWQTPTALGIVAITAAAFVWRRFRPRRFSFEKHLPCGCSGGGSGPRPPGLTVAGRRGEIPRVVLKP